MKKLVLFMLLFSCLVVIARAQDIIVMNTGEEIKSKIVELTDTHVKYKKFSNFDGPVYNLVRGEVFMLLYANGEREVITSAKAPVEKAPPPVKATRSVVQPVSVITSSDSTSTGIITELPRRKSHVIPSFSFIFGGSDMGQEFWLGSGYVLSVGIPISKDKTVTLGTSYHYMGYAKEGVRYNINQFTFDLMGIGKGWNGIYRIGIPFSCTASYEGSKTSVQDIVNPINISIGGGYGWSVGNLCLGVNIEIRMSNLFKKKQIDNKGSMGFNMGTVLSYRF